MAFWDWNLIVSSLTVFASNIVEVEGRTDISIQLRLAPMVISMLSFLAERVQLWKLAMFVLLLKLAEVFPPDHAPDWEDVQNMEGIEVLVVCCSQYKRGNGALAPRSLRVCPT